MKDYDRFVKEFEIALLWENGCDRETLSINTGISVRTLQKFINTYIQSSNETVSYNKKYKAYIASEYFSPILINDDPEYYLNFCLGERLQQPLLNKGNIAIANRLSIENIQSLTTSNIDDLIMNTLIHAINSQSQILGTYIAKKGTRSDIVLSPHSLALVRNRYHIRAYHHKYDRFSDFVVGRFDTVKLHSKPKEGISAEHDSEWQTLSNLVFELNPELTHEERESFSLEWNLPLHSNQKIIRCRQALAKYVRYEMENTTIGTEHKTWIYKGEL